LTSCFTVNNIKKAKLDRKPQIVDSILSSYKDYNGNVNIVYTKQRSKNLYKSVIPVDTIIQRYRQAKTIDFINTDTAIKDFKGVFFAENINNQKGFQRLIYFQRENAYADTSKLFKDIENNKNVVHVVTSKIVVPVFEADTTIIKSHTKSKVVAFIVTPDNNSMIDLNRQETYIAVFEPNKKKYSRYFLTPLTVGLDVATLPGQILFYGTLLLVTKTIKF
jgi:hypothetical protein